MHFVFRDRCHRPTRSDLIIGALPRDAPYLEIYPAALLWPAWRVRRCGASAATGGRCSGAADAPGRSLIPCKTALKASNKLHPKQLAETLNFSDRVFAEKLRLNGVHQAHLVLRTIRLFCQSADPNFGIQHVPQ
jgi:hypothetical protein